MKTLTVIGISLAMVTLGLSQFRAAVVLVVVLLASGLGLVWWLTNSSLGIERPPKAPASWGSSDQEASPVVVRGAIRAGDPSVPPPAGN